MPVRVFMKNIPPQTLKTVEDAKAAMSARLVDAALQSVQAAVVPEAAKALLPVVQALDEVLEEGLVDLGEGKDVKKTLAKMGKKAEKAVEKAVVAPEASAPKTPKKSK